MTSLTRERPAGGAPLIVGERVRAQRSDAPRLSRFSGSSGLRHNTPGRSVETTPSWSTSPSRTGAANFVAPIAQRDSGPRSTNQKDLARRARRRSPLSESTPAPQILLVADGSGDKSSSTWRRDRPRRAVELSRGGSRRQGDPPAFEALDQILSQGGDLDPAAAVHLARTRTAWRVRRPRQRRSADWYVDIESQIVYPHRIRQVPGPTLFSGDTELSRPQSSDNTGKTFAICPIPKFTRSSILSRPSFSAPERRSYSLEDAPDSGCTGVGCSLVR